MRSRTLSDLPGRCKRCWLKEALCLCAALPRVESSARVLFVRHVLEGFKSSNTARFAHLALPGSEVIDFEPANDTLDARMLGDLSGAWLVFPGGSDSVPAEPPPRTLVFLDGTWRQTRRMLNRSPALLALPRLSFAPRAGSARRLRHSIDPASISTLEAVARALELIDGEAAAAPLLTLHEQVVTRVLVGRGTLPRSAVGGTAIPSTSSGSSRSDR